MPEPTCSQCPFWHRQSVDPANLGAAPQGQCRKQPHAVAMSPQVEGVPPFQRVTINAIAIYLSTPANFPACSAHPEYQPGNLRALLSSKGGEQ